MHEVNERFLEVLQQVARGDAPVALVWMEELREVLLRTTADVRRRAARRAFLLVDMQFGNAQWWRHITSRRTRLGPSAAHPDIFPRETAIELARAVLTLAWHAVRADRIAAIACLGMTRAVLDIIRRLSLAEINRIAPQRFLDVRPRWEDRPEEWRRLLIDGQSRDVRRTREVDVRGLRLIAGAFLTSMIPMVLRSKAAHSAEWKETRCVARAQENIEAWLNKTTGTPESIEGTSIKNSR
jgi:hypothetical protein